jgi:hypothetical protein
MLSHPKKIEFGGIEMEFTKNQNNSIISIREKAKQLLRQLRPEDAVKIYNEVVKEKKNVL